MRHVRIVRWMEHRRRNLYWASDVDKKAEDLAWASRCSVSKLLTALVLKAAETSAQTLPDQPEKDIEATGHDTFR